MKRHPITGWFDFILNSFAYIAGMLILAMTLMVSYASVARYIGLKPPVWVLQFTEYALLWITFFGAGWLLREGGHIRVDTIISRFGSSTRHFINLVDDFLGLGVSLILFIMGTRNTIDLYQRQIMEFNAVILPKYLIFWAIPFGGLLLVAQFFRAIVHQVQRKT